MNRPHQHGPECPSHCSREWELDETTPTGAYRVVTRSGYGNRPKRDKPRWWPFAFHAYKALVQLAGLVALAWLAKRLGLANIQGGP